jgi:hypothetical protein
VSFLRHIQVEFEVCWWSVLRWISRENKGNISGQSLVQVAEVYWLSFKSVLGTNSSEI